MYIDDSHKLRPEPVLGPATLAATTTSAAIDLLNSGANALVIAVGVGGIAFSGANKIEFKLTHSDDDTAYTEVGTDQVVLREGADTMVGAGGVVLSLTAAHPNATTARLGYIGAKRYLKVQAAFGGAHGTGTPIAVLLIRSHLSLDGEPSNYNA